MNLLCRILARWVLCCTPVAVAAQAEVAPTTFPNATVAADASGVSVETVASGLAHPWGLALLPDGRFLVTERAGRMRLVSATGQVSAPLAGLPAVFAQGQGGLLDVVLDPDFASNRTVFFSYAEPGEGNLAGTAVAKGVLGEAAVSQVQVIFRQLPKFPGELHFGARLVFGRDKTLWITLGDRCAQKDLAQVVSNTIGKVLRVTRDGGVPKDNPFQGVANASPELWSIGHRNVQAAALHPHTGQLWTVEHGAQGGDEVNVPAPGSNQGWPLITYGVNYGGAPIGMGTAAPGLAQPIHYFDPSIAPSGAAFYQGAAFAAWQGDLLVGALRGTHLARLTVRDGRVTAEQRYLSDLKLRIRDVRVSPKGWVYVLSDHADGKLLRLRPR